MNAVKSFVIDVFDRGNHAKVVEHLRLDSEDYHRLKEFTWYLDKDQCSAYRLDGPTTRIYARREVMGFVQGDGNTVISKDGNHLNCTRANLEHGPTKDLSYILPRSSKGIRFPRTPENFIKEVVRIARREKLPVELLDILKVADWGNWARMSDHLIMKFEEGSDELMLARKFQESGALAKFFDEWLSWTKPIAIQAFSASNVSPLVSQTDAATQSKAELAVDSSRMGASSEKPSPDASKIPMFDLSDGAIKIGVTWMWPKIEIIVSKSK